MDSGALCNMEAPGDAVLGGPGHFEDIEAGRELGEGTD